ncbi:hypothetical protein [Agrobacterium cavarae]|uniref:hypothetical protein n=1 Tax=Agrobacterium cavarae TaxID=2528239 RepID=UPI002899A979|nr:hypothetical protein [Agrobacterium cavarae]
MARKCIEERHKVLLGAPVPHRLGEDRHCEFSTRCGEWLRREPPGFLTTMPPRIGSPICSKPYQRIRRHDAVEDR